MTAQPNWAGRLLSAIFKSNGGPQMQPEPYGAVNLIGAKSVVPNAATGDLDVTLATGGAGGQFNLTLTNGTNSNVTTDGSLLQVVGGPTGAFALGGFSTVSFAVLGGQEMVVTNPTGQPFSILNNDASSTVKILTPNGQKYVVGAFGGQASVRLAYDSSAGKLRVTNNGAQQPIVRNVVEYGADPTGTADSYQAIQNAINDAGLGGHVFFPPNPDGTVATYLTSKQLLISDVAGIKGIRLTSTSRNIDGAFQAVLRYTGGALASGAAASIGVLAANPDTPGINTLMPITGVAGATSAWVGQSIRLSGCATAANNFTYTIQAITSATAIVVVANNYSETTYATQNVGSDANSGSISWEVIPNVIQCYSRGCSVEMLYIDGNGHAAAAVDSTYYGSGDNCSGNKAFDCQFVNCVYGIKIGDIQPTGGSAGRYPNNCELHVVHRCYGTTLGHSVICIPNTTLQSKQHSIDDVSMASTPYGIWMKAGSFYAKNLNCTSLSLGAIQVFGPSGEGVEVHNIGLEDCLRIFTWQSSSANFCKITGIRYDVLAEANLPNDGTNVAYLIRYNPPTGLDINGANIVAAQSYTRQCQFLVENGSGLAAATIRNVLIGNSSGDFVKGGGGGSGSYMSVGNGYNAGGTFHAIPDGLRPVTRTDGAVYTSYTRAPWLTQATAKTPFLVGQAHYVWSGIANGSNNDMALPPNTPIIVDAGSAPTAGWTLTGIVASIDGDEIELTNLTGQALTLAHASGSSTAANRFVCPKAADITNVWSFKARYLATVATPGWYVQSYTQTV